MGRKFTANDYRAIVFSLVSIYVLLASVVAVQAVEFAKTAGESGFFARLLGVILYLNPVHILGAL
jgi:hypothetical protein